MVFDMMTHRYRRQSPHPRVWRGPDRFEAPSPNRPGRCCRALRAARDLGEGLEREAVRSLNIELTVGDEGYRIGDTLGTPASSFDVVDREPAMEESRRLPDREGATPACASSRTWRSRAVQLTDPVSPTASVPAHRAQVCSCTRRGAGTVTRRPRPERGRLSVSEPAAPGQDRQWAHGGDTARSSAATVTWGDEDPVAADEGAAPQRQASRRRHGRAVHAVIDQATGVVMALGRLRAEQAGTVLTEVSRRTNVTLRRIAELLTAWVHTGELNLGIRIALEEAIRRQHHIHRAAGPPADALDDSP